MVIVFVLFWLGVVLFCVQIAWHVRVIWDGKPSGRKNCVPERLRYVLRTALGQTRIVERPWGWAHVILMWTFFVFLTSGLEMLIACLSPGFTWQQVFGARVHGVLCVIQTWFAWASICGLVVVTTRRIVSRRLTFTNFDACFILADIFILMVTHLLSMSAMIALGRVSGAGWMPLESAMASIMEPAWAERIHAVSSVIHLLLMAVFLVWIPNSKHLHIVMAWPDIFFFSREWLGKGKPSYSPDPVDFEAYEKAVGEAVEAGKEEMPTIGLATFRDTTRKQRLEAFSCTLCKRCDNVCPMTRIVGIPDGPMTSLVRLRKMCVAAESRRQRILAWGVKANKKGDSNVEDLEEQRLVPELMAKDALWQCTQCGACDRACPLSHEHTLRVMMMRQNAVAQQEDVPPTLSRAFEMTERSGNPWGYPKKDRALLWTTGDSETTPGGRAAGDVNPTAKASGGAETKQAQRIVIFAGCMASYHKEAAVTLRRVRRWLEEAGFSVSMLEGETCCGEPLRRAGNEFGFDAQARENVARLQAAKPDMIVTTCPHCAFTLSDSYHAYGLDVPVHHILSFWLMLMDAGKLRLEPKNSRSLALHVPCYLSKYSDQSAAIVRMLSGVGYEVRQTEDARRAMCCGAGGAHFFFDEKRKIAKARALELQELHAEIIGTLCPFCTQMLGDELQNSGGNTLTTCVNVIDELADRVHVVRA